MKKDETTKDMQMEQQADTAMTTDGAPAPGVVPPPAPLDAQAEMQPKRRSKLSLRKNARSQ